MLFLVLAAMFGGFWLVGAYVATPLLILFTVIAVVSTVRDNIWKCRDSQGSEHYAVSWPEIYCSILILVYVWAIALYVRGYWSWAPMRSIWSMAKPYLLR